MTEKVKCPPYWKPYFRSSSEIERRLVDLLENYGLGRGSLERGYYRQQEWNFELPLPEVVSLTGGKSIFFGQDSRRTLPSTAPRHSDSEPTEFNRLVLELFEPILYFAYSASGEDDSAPGNLSEKHLSSLLPLWLVVLEVEEGQLSYSTFLFRERSPLDTPKGLFDCHRAYDDPRTKNSSITGITNLLVKARKNEIKSSFAPIIVSIGNPANRPTPSLLNFLSVTSYSESRFTIVWLSPDLVETIDKKILSSLAPRNKPQDHNSYGILIEQVASEVGTRFLELLDQHVSWEPPPPGNPVAFQWEKEEPRKRLNYLIWLRTLAVAGGASQKATNFQTYLYFPVPDLIKDYVHTVTAAFSDWPDPRLFLLLERNLAKMFPRSRIVSSQREKGQVFNDFAHEIGDVLTVLNKTNQSRAEVKAQIDLAKANGEISSELGEALLAQHSENLQVSPAMHQAVTDYIALWSRTEDSVEAYSAQIRPDRQVSETLLEMWSQAATIAVARRGKIIRKEHLVLKPDLLDQFVKQLDLRFFDVPKHIFFGERVASLESPLYRSLIATLHNSIGHSVERLGKEDAAFLPIGLQVLIETGSASQSLVLRLINGFRGSIRPKDFGTKAVVTSWIQKLQGDLLTFEELHEIQKDELAERLVRDRSPTKVFDTKLSFPLELFYFEGNS